MFCGNVVNGGGQEGRGGVTPFNEVRELHQEIPSGNNKAFAVNNADKCTSCLARQHVCKHVEGAALGAAMKGSIGSIEKLAEMVSGGDSVIYNIIRSAMAAEKNQIPMNTQD